MVAGSAGNGTADAGEVLEKDGESRVSKESGQIASAGGGGGEPALSVLEKMEKPLQPGDLLLLKEELFENEAWEFLTSASEKLFLLGVDILLPSWWEALKKANLRLKARVRTGSGGPSFVGLNALLISSGGYR